MRPRALFFAFSAALVACGCDPGFDPPSRVRDLRVLAMRADPPEHVVSAGPPGTSTVTALIVDPTSDAPRPYRWQVCEPTITLRCEDAQVSRLLEEGTAPPSELSVTVPVDPELLDRARAVDPLMGLAGAAVMVQLTYGAEHAVKQVMYTPAFFLPSGAQPNANPSGVAFTGPDAGGVEHRAGDIIDAPPAGDVCVYSPAGSAEHFRTYSFQGQVIEVDENLTFYFYATDGTFRSDTQTARAGSIAPERANAWVPPDRPGLIRFWVVVRDGRGGVNW